MCMVHEVTGAGALFDLSTGRRISLPPHCERYFSSCGSIIGNGDMVCSYAAMGVDPVSGRYKVFKSTLYYDSKLFSNRQWVFTLGVDKSWREIRPLFTGYTYAAVHIRGIIYFIPQISDQSPYIVAMDVARERVLRVIPFPPCYQSCRPQRNYGWVSWIKLNGRLAFIIMFIPRQEGWPSSECKIEIWTFEVEWEKQTVLVPLEESEAFDQAISIGFASNSMGEIVFLLFLCERMSPLILVYSFRRDVWRRVEIAGVSKYPKTGRVVTAVHIDDEIAASFLE
ncbi:PREDICTED: F-box protein At5g62510-like [Ipomoea nil]|uniref:F-box protein At5g62510-like n=1 Tax=Ipomoea nil TaxID=35883 RepID=UPI000900D5B0|nr:PREDICTED: F-box protein At5g62510-like [Ipomoea nil]